MVYAVNPLVGLFRPSLHGLGLFHWLVSAGLFTARNYWPVKERNVGRFGCPACRAAA